MFNPTQIPSLAPILDKVLADAGVVVAAGKVSTDNTHPGRIFANFTLLSREVAKLTADELYLLYLKPAVEEIGAKIIKFADGQPICTRALSLPPEGNEVVGFRNWQGSVPVNIYIARRPTPDRHQFIIDTVVDHVKCECDLCQCFGTGECADHDENCPQCNDPEWVAGNHGTCDWCEEI
jgi:hypothetical protein